MMDKYKNSTKNDNKLGFTVVELLVVVVAIAILAAITIVSYNGITKRATESMLKSDLRQVANQLELEKTDTGSYPATENGLKVSSATQLQYTQNSSSSYCTTVRAKGIEFYIDSSTGIIQEGACNGHTAPIDPSNRNLWKQISSGAFHTCAIASDDQAYCWGWGAHGQLGNNSTADLSVPVAVSTTGVLAGKTIKQISAGHSHTCVVASDDRAYCWGMGLNGRLGNNSTTDSLVPSAVNTSGVLLAKAIKQIDSGYQHTCATTLDNQAYCWGAGSYGQLGNNSNTDSSVPVPISTVGILAGKTIKQIRSADSHTCATASDGNAYCWGRGELSQLGNNSTAHSSIPVAVSDSGVLAGKTIKQIDAVGFHTCAIASDDHAYCWGRGNFGQLGNNSTAHSSIPVAVSDSGVLAGKTIKQISGGYAHTCAIASDNQTYCWGSGGSGRLGNNSTADSSVPVATINSGALSGKTIRQISTGRENTCAIASDDRAYCWGRNNRGQVGNNSTTDSLNPELVLPRP